MAGAHWKSWKQKSNVVVATWPGERSLRGFCLKDATHTVLMTLSDSWTQLPTNQRCFLGGTVTAGRLVAETVVRWLSAALATGEGVTSYIIRKIANDIQEGSFPTVGNVEQLSPRARRNFEEYRALTNNEAWLLGQIRLQMVLMR
jgi:hypothetical protein